MTNQRVVLLFTSVSLLAACAQAPTATAPGHGATPGAEAVLAPESAPPTVPSGPVTPALQQQAQKLAISAASLLESGHEDQAKAELQRALAIDPNHKLALSLLRQISADPVATLGRESFSYVVRPNDSMSALAGRFLGDIYSFYILARYNGIAVPKQVAGGQTLKIPGKAPPPSVQREPTPRVEANAPPPPAPPPAVPPPPPPPPEATPGEKAMRAADAAERSGDLERA
ncbi:MAG TPA: LysM domain-containing protein, partial [Albitalea sp.]|nr:LysM domain-containing protein [Albitalea sp.]